MYTLTRIAISSLAALLLAATAQAQKLSFSHADTVYRDERGAALQTPEGVACGADGTVLVADTGSRRLLRFRLVKGKLRGGTPLKTPQVEYPTRVHISSGGEALVLDRKRNAIARLNEDGAYSGDVELTKVTGGSEVVVGSFALDASDDLYVLDLAERRVIVASASGVARHQIALPRDAGSVTDIAVDKAGAVYAVDASKLRLYRAPGTATEFATLTDRLPDELIYPTHLAMNPSRSALLVSDQHGGGLLSLTLDGTSLGYRLGKGWREGFVYYPSQLCTTKGGALVLADRGNDRIQVFGGGR